MTLATARLADAATSDPMRFLWRRSAFVISGMVFAVHILYERLRLHSAARAAAWHVSLAVALGAFALALMANVHDLQSPSGYRLRMLVALVAWPLLTAVPAFLVALVVAAGLGPREPRA